MLGRRPQLHHHEHRHSTSTTVNVTEKRAPTDESVALLREMEAKAEAEVLKAVKVDANSFSCVVHHGLDNMSDRVLWRAIFDLNGKKMDVKVATDPRDADWQHFDALRDEMAKEIAGRILNDAFVRAIRERSQK